MSFDAHPGATRAALTAVCGCLRDFAADECGQDLIEYALLTAAVGLAGAATWPAIVESIGTAYRALNENADALWVPPPPGSP